mmetsp:Transcript_34295/g.67426  ORF Transcript_34295/g.67426 Transcript_34295/m.67426 type:complete len:683 (+) Transcript_34295:84-2132(+)
MDQSAATTLASNHSLLAETLSYIVYNTCDVARFRFVSREWNMKVLPFVLKSAGFIKNCYPNTDFIEGLVESIDYEAYTGMSIRDLESVDIFQALFRQGVKVRSILFITGDEVERDIDVVITSATTEAFAAQAKTLCNTRSFDEFNRVADAALKGGMFFSVEELEHECDNYVPEEDCLSDVEVHAFAAIITIDAPRDEVKIVRDGICPTATFVSTEGNEHVAIFASNSTFKGYVTEENEDRITCLVPLCLNMEFDTWMNFRYARVGVELLYFTSLWSKSQERSLVPEGVALADGLVSETLHLKLMQQINALAEKTVADYHPHSNGIVRDLVHPALYPFVNGLSTTLPLGAVPPAIFPQMLDERDQYDSEIATDYWGRAYEESVNYQWIPTYFNVETDGSCTIDNYINNLVPRSEYETLYQSLSELFSHALPLIESVFSYGRSVRPRICNNDDDFESDNYYDSDLKPIEEIPYSLHGQKLQVITKIVDYELKPGQTYEGVWHVEGMSHEQIVATAIYFIHRDDDIVGGDILFKRAFHKNESNFVVQSMRPRIHPCQTELIQESMLPLGKVKTLPGRLLVFPNSHVHKVTKLENSASKPDKKMPVENSSVDTNFSNLVQKRRIVVFFLINPEERIVSTREVPPQQKEFGGNMSYFEAMEHRLALMKERKYTKQDWNIREIELCEH